MGFRWRGRFAGGGAEAVGAVGVVVFILPVVFIFPHCKASFAMPMVLSSDNDNAVGFCTGCWVSKEYAGAGAGGGFALGFGGALFRFWPTSGVGFAVTTGEGTSVIPSGGFCLKASRTRSSSGLNSSPGTVMDPTG